MKKCILLIIITVVVSSLLMPVTMMVSAQTEEGGRDAVIVTSGANETAATATAGGNNNMTGAKFLFIQSAQSGSVSEVNATTSTLELSGISDKTILFSDRPDRIVMSVDTADFIGNWSTGRNNFTVDPPNAVLVIDDVEQRQDLAVIELYNPEYKPEASVLKYDIIAENATSIDLPGEFGQSTLVIDSDSLPLIALQYH